MCESIVEYFYSSTDSGHKCGYCKSPKGNVSRGMWAHTLSPNDYQNLLDKGWRRSGHYVYKPNNEKTCCPMLTISCRAKDFSLGKSHKKILKSFLTTANPSFKSPPKTVKIPYTPPPSKLNKSKTKRLLRRSEKTGKPLEKTIYEKKELEDFLTVTENLVVQTLKTNGEEFESKLGEIHALYEKYQMEIHKDSKSECSLKQFRRFLVDSPLNHRNKDPLLGSHHQLYYLQTRLIAVGVIDILPSVLSSVYFFYDPELMALNLGTFGALYEIYFTRNTLKYDLYYMGFYIHNCVKMKYKSGFKPSFLLIGGEWVELGEELRGKLDRGEVGRGDGGQGGDINQVRILHNRKIMSYKQYARKVATDTVEIQEYATLCGQASHSMLLYRDGD